uniref:Uncharacterized protein n=1 Tax=Glossina austeni TaxID=7395 RepID=A0A1A9VDW6_GLOAU
MYAQYSVIQTAVVAADDVTFVLVAPLVATAAASAFICAVTGSALTTAIERASVAAPTCAVIVQGLGAIYMFFAALHVREVFTVFLRSLGILRDVQILRIAKSSFPDNAIHASATKFVRTISTKEPAAKRSTEPGITLDAMLHIEHILPNLVINNLIAMCGMLSRVMENNCKLSQNSACAREVCVDDRNMEIILRHC